MVSTLLPIIPIPPPPKNKQLGTKLHQEVFEGDVSYLTSSTHTHMLRQIGTECLIWEFSDSQEQHSLLCRRKKLGLEPFALTGTGVPLEAQVRLLTPLGSTALVSNKTSPGRPGTAELGAGAGM